MEVKHTAYGLSQKRWAAKCLFLLWGRVLPGRVSLGVAGPLTPGPGRCRVPASPQAERKG